MTVDAAPLAAGLTRTRGTRLRGLRILDVRVPSAGRLAVGMAVLAFGAFLWISRDFQFFYDEWDFVLQQPSSAGAYFLPHNEHWSTVPIVVYQLLVHAFGIRSHVPFMATVLAMHVLSCLVLFRIVRRRAGDVPALFAIALMLVLGWGADDFLWAFQISFQGSVLFGLVAVDQLDSGRFGFLRAAAVSAALLLALASSSLGVAFLVVAAVELAVERGRRRRAVALIAPVAAYATWLLVVGAHVVHPPASVFSVGGVLDLVQYLLLGIAAGAAAILGFGQSLGLAAMYAALVALAGLIALALRRSWDGRVLGALAGLLALFGSAGLVRLQLGASQAASRRYTYVAVIFLLLITALALRALPWRRLTAVALGGLLACGVLGNVIALSLPVALWTNESAAQGVELRTLNDVRGAPDLDPNELPDRVLMPTVAVESFFRAEDRFGQPVSSESIATLAQANPALVDSTLRAVFAHALQLHPEATRSTCGGGALPTELRIPAGGTATLRIQGSGSLTVAIGWAAAPADVLTTQVGSGAWQLRVPDTGLPAFTWRVVVQPAASVTTVVCTTA